MRQIITTDQAPQAIGPYSQAVQAGDYLFISGQLPVNPVTGKIDSPDVVQQAEQVITNLSNILSAAGLDFNDLVKVTLMLADMNDFKVVNEVYSRHITSKPARATFQVAGLPLNARIEAEAIAYRPVTGNETKSTTNKK